MKIWVDADACPLMVKNILYKAAGRTQTLVVLVSNQFLQIPASPFIKKMRVSAGFDVADKEIVKQMEPGDLVITADIPLADAVVEKGGIALNPRGELYSINNIKQRLSIRDFNEQLRSSGVRTGGPAKLSAKEIQAFANCLDRLLTKTK
ncbi:MAG: YaiI/YqxD family protein [Gammaproteobacteria bacterium]|nr:YaiI/YqxD family protein [Gammaproteobacteria bacterium]